MDHPFVSHRSALRSCRRGLEMIEDMTMITTASSLDVKCIAERRDCDISDDRVKQCVSRHSSRLGRLVSDVSDACRDVSIVVPPAFTDLERRWTSFITASAAESGGDLATTIRTVTKPIVDALEAARAEHERFEQDDGSSSASDYSDSDTETTTSRGSDDDDPSEEEEDSGEEEQTPPKRQGRHR